MVCPNTGILDPNKRVNQLSVGMEVKYTIALALTHDV